MDKSPFRTNSPSLFKISPELMIRLMFGILVFLEGFILGQLFHGRVYLKCMCTMHVLVDKNNTVLNSVLPRLLLQGAAPCPLFVTPCPFEKAEMTPCPFDNFFFFFNISHMWLLALFCPFCCPHTAWIVL